VSKYALCFLLIPLHSVLATGWNDYDIDLYGGYRLVRNNADDITIFKEDMGFVIPPRIRALNVDAGIVFGAVEKPPDADVLNLLSVPGFFILNTKTESVQIGLDEQAWLNALRALGFAKPPSLREPSRFFMWRLFIRKFLKLSWSLLGVSVLLIACNKWRKARKRKGSSAAVKS
jgi:hypothetical protein